jgi:hypothetical protein
MATSECARNREVGGVWSVSGIGHLTARLVAEHPGLDLQRDLAPLAFGGVTRFRIADGSVLRLDHLLGPVASRPTALDPGTRLLTARDDLSVVVGSNEDDLIVATGTASDEVVHRLALGPADSATFVTPHHLVVTAPVTEPVPRDGEVDEMRGQHRIVLVDVARGTVLDQTLMAGVNDAVVVATPHPGDGSVVLDAGEGQDGSHVAVVRVESERLVVEPWIENVVVAGFDPGGQRLLLTPHPSFEGRATIVALAVARDPLVGDPRRSRC